MWSAFSAWTYRCNCVLSVRKMRSNCHQHIVCSSQSPTNIYWARNMRVVKRLSGTTWLPHRHKAQVETFLPHSKRQHFLQPCQWVSFKPKSTHDPSLIQLALTLTWFELAYALARAGKLLHIRGRRSRNTPARNSFITDTHTIGDMLQSNTTLTITYEHARFFNKISFREDFPAIDLHYEPVVSNPQPEKDEISCKQRVAQVVDLTMDRFEG